MSLCAYRTIFTATPSCPLNNLKDFRCSVPRNNIGLYRLFRRLNWCDQFLLAEGVTKMEVPVWCDQFFLAVLAEIFLMVIHVRKSKCSRYCELPALEQWKYSCGAGRENRTPVLSLARIHSTTKPYPHSYIL